MMKKSRLLIPFALLGLILTGCTKASELQDNFSEEDLAINTPWSDFYLPAVGVEFKEGEESISINKGDTYTYHYSIQPNGATANSLNWFSGNEEIATVANGVVTGVGGGETTITASSPDNAFEPVELSVQVNVPLVGFEVDNAITSRMDWDETYQVSVTYDPADTTYRDLVYEIVDPSVAGLVSVNDQGVITTSNQNGTAKLKVYSEFLGEEHAKTYNLTISTIGVTSVTVSQANNIHEVEVDHTVQLSATVLPADATELARRGARFYSRNADVATVDEVTGIVTGVSEGTAQIYASCGGIESPNYEISVFEVHATSAAITTPAFALSNATDNGLTKQLEYTITTDRAGYEASKATVSFESLDPSVASVNNTGLVTAVGHGNTSIKLIVAQPGLANVEATVDVSVTIVSKTLVINGGNSFYNDSTLTLSAVLTPANVSNDEITWSVTPDTVVSLSDTTGASVTLTPVNNETTGQVTVTATNTDGASNTLQVTVAERPSTFTAGDHYIVGNKAYNSGSSVAGHESWSAAKYAYHFTYEVQDPTVYEQFKGTIHFEANDEFRYFIGPDYWVPASHIEHLGALAASGGMHFSSDGEDANIVVDDAGWYDLYAKLYKNNDGSLWYSLYIGKVPALSVEVEELTMGYDEDFQIVAHDWIGSLSYTLTSGNAYVALDPQVDGLVHGIATADGDAVITLEDGRGLTATVTIHVRSGAQLSKTVYLNANGKFDADNVVPFIHSWGGTSAAANVKMEKVSGQNIVYSASIPVDHTSLVFARAPQGTTSIDDNSWGLFYNKTEDLTIPTNGNDMFKQTGYSADDVKDDHHRTYVVGVWEQYNSAITYEIDDSQPEVQTNIVKLYFCNAQNWDDSAMSAYAWGQSEEAAWPGKAMTYVGLDTDSHKVYSYDVDLVKYQNIIFVSNTDQTVDIDISAAVNNQGYTPGAKDNNKYPVSAYTYVPQSISASYTVSFNANGGSGTMDPVENVSGSYTLPANGFTAPSGQHFTGWKVANAGDLLHAGASYSVSADVTLYAQWADDVVPNNVTIYLTNNWNWATLKAYVFDHEDATNYKVAWPGENLTYVGINDDNDDIYSYTVDINTYDRLIFANGGEGVANQTVDIDISAAVTGNAYYFSGRESGDDSKITVGTWNYTSGAITSKQACYFTNNKSWTDVKFYVFNSGTDVSEVAWPGSAAKWVAKNNDNQDVYRVLIDTTQFDSFIFNGSGGQSVDIALSSLTGENNAFYLLDTQDGLGHYEVGQWKYVRAA